MKNRNLKTLAVFAITMFATIVPSMGWTKSTEQKAKDAIDKLSDSLKKAVDEVGDDVAAAQNYLNNYHWKGMIQDKASSGPATLKHLQLNDHARAVVVRPGERIHCQVVYKLNKHETSALSVYQVIVGINGLGPQISLGKDLGAATGESMEKFEMIAPTEPGVYQVRFRFVKAVLESSAFDEWKDANGNEPDATTTIGIIVVKN